MKRFVCDCCEKIGDTQENVKSPDGWGKVLFTVRSSHSMVVNIRGDLCPGCLKAFSESDNNLFELMKKKKK